MDIKDCFYTTSYRGVYIYSCLNRTKKREEFIIQGWPTVVLSLHSAKIRITKMLGKP